MVAADQAWRGALREITIADLARAVSDDYGPGALAGIGTWLAAYYS